MKKDVGVEGKGKGKHDQEQRGRIKNPGLNIAHKGGSTKVVRAPEREGTHFQGGGKEKFHGIEPPVDIPEEKCLFRKEGRIKKKANKAQNHEDVARILNLFEKHL